MHPTKESRNQQNNAISRIASLLYRLRLTIDNPVQHVTSLLCPYLCLEWLKSLQQSCHTLKDVFLLFFFKGLVLDCCVNMLYYDYFEWLNKMSMSSAAPMSVVLLLNYLLFLVLLLFCFEKIKLLILIGQHFISK